MDIKITITFLRFTNIPNYYNNIDLILDEIWSLLQRGVADRNEDFRLPVVIVSSTDSAEGRIVVLRGAFKDKNILRFHTDFRSGEGISCH